MSGVRAVEPGASRDGALQLLASQQAGFLTVGQILRSGYRSTDLPALVSNGTVVRVDGDLYRVARWPVHELDEFARWCAFFEGAAAVSHHTAAVLHGFGSLSPQYLHMSAARALTARANSLAMHWGDLPAEDVESAGCFRITTPLRTVLDLADCGVSQALLDEVVTDAVAIDRVDADTLSDAAWARTPRVAERVDRALVALS